MTVIRNKLSEIYFLVKFFKTGATGRIQLRERVMAYTVNDWIGWTNEWIAHLNNYLGKRDRVAVGKAATEWRIGFTLQDRVTGFEQCQGWKVKTEISQAQIWNEQNSIFGLIWILLKIMTSRGSYVLKRENGLTVFHSMFNSDWSHVSAPPDGCSELEVNISSTYLSLIEKTTFFYCDWRRLRVWMLICLLFIFGVVSFLFDNLFAISNYPQGVQSLKLNYLKKWFRFFSCSVNFLSGSQFSVALLILCLGHLFHRTRYFEFQKLIVCGRCTKVSFQFIYETA